MADDITLTVRVRDLSQGQLSRINQQVNRLDRNFRNAGDYANRTSTSWRTLGNDISRLNSRFRQMVSTGQLTRNQLGLMNRDLSLVSRGLRNAFRSGDIDRSYFRSFSRDLDMLRSRMVLVGRQGNVFTRLGARVALLREHFRRMTEWAGRFGLAVARLGDWGAIGISRSLRALGAMASVLGSVGRALSKVSQTMLIFMAIIALIGPAAQALGAILVTALAGAFVALGAYALHSTAQIKGAFTQMKSTLGSVLRESAAPLQESLVKAMGQVSIAARQMQPLLRSAFSATAPLVQNLVGAFTDLAQQALPGIVFALQNSQKAMAGFRQAMGSIGAGIGNMFKIITDGNDANLAKAWVVLGDEIKNALESIGEFTSSMLKSGSATLLMIGIFRTFTGILNIVSGVFQTLDTLLGGLPGHIANVIDSASKIGTTFGDAVDLSSMSITQMKDKLKEVNEAIKEQQKLLDNKNLPGPVKSHIKDNLNDLLKERKDLLGAISAAEGTNADAVNNEATAYRNLLQAIEALAEQNRSYLDSVAAEQQAIDDADKKLKDAKKNHENYSGALKMVKGQLDLTSQTGRDAYDMLSKIASATKDATDKAVAANVPWKQVQANWDTGFNKIVRLADGMGLTTEQARQLATQILGLPPSKDVVIRAQTQDAIASLDGVIAAMQAQPSAKTITVKALTGEAQQLLRSLGLEVTQMPDGSFTITAHTGSASEKIAGVKAARDGLKGKSITLSAQDASTGTIRAIIGWIQRVTGKTVVITTVHRNVIEQVFSAPKTQADALRQQAERLGGGAIGGSAAQIAARGFATGGSIAGTLLQGPGTTTSDSILARLSRGEFVMKAAAVRKYGVGAMMAINSGLLDRIPGFAKGGGVTKAEKDARSEYYGDLSVSHFGRIQAKYNSGYNNDEFVHQLGMSESVGDLVSNLNKWRTAIQKMTHGATESKLLKQLDKAGDSLLKYQNKLYTVNKKLDDAKQKLDDLKNSASQLKDSIKSNIINETNITKSAGADDSQVTINTLLSQMSANAGQASAFDKALKDLAKRGLSKDLIQQIAEAGLTGGGLETATAILGGSNSQIKSLNALEAQIQKAAGSTGQTAADAMYKAGIQAAQGLVDGLTKQQKDIEKAMLNIAKSMEKAIKKALGIKSPSRVMMKIGDQTAEGFAIGIRENQSAVSAVQEMVTSVVSGRVPQAISRSVGMRTAHKAVQNVISHIDYSGRHPHQTYGGSVAYERAPHYDSSKSNSPTVIQVQIGDKHVGEVLLDPLRKAVRNRGGNVQAVLGK